MFLFDLVVAHGEASDEVAADFFWREGSESVVDGDEEVRAIACEGEEASFVGLEFDGDGTGLTRVGSDAVWLDRCVVDSVHEEFVGDASDSGDDAFVDADIGGIFRHGVE